MRKLGVVAMVVMALALTACTGLSQMVVISARGSVTGTLVQVGGPAGEPTLALPGQVTAQNSAGFKFTVTAGKSGKFVLSLPAAVYQLTGHSPMVGQIDCAAAQPVCVKAWQTTLGVWSSVPLGEPCRPSDFPLEPLGVVRKTVPSPLCGSMATVRLRLLVLVVLALTLTAGTSFQSVSRTTTTLTAKPLPVVDAAATPEGWVPVAYGDAQVSVPSTWAVLTHAWCGGTWPPIVQLGVVKQDLLCLATPSPPTVRITPLSSIPARYRHEQPVLLNGIPVLRGPKAATSVSYFVPSLHVELWAGDGAGTRVTDTLAVSPRAVVLASGPGPAVPSSWRSVSFAGLRFSVPADWPVSRTSGAAFGLGTPCATSGVAFPAPGVTLSTDQHRLRPPTCTGESYGYAPQPPMNGAQVDSGGHFRFLATLSFAKHCLDLYGLSACPATSPAYSILVLRVKVPGRSKPVYVSIGLAGNGMVARTILYSLREA